MSCPNCSAEMNVVNFDNQIILHCPNCGGSFFEENSINRISRESAFQLSQDKKTTEVSGQGKECPKDLSALKPILTDSTDLTDQPFPPDVTLLECPKCRGIFAYPDDLVKFKKAQNAKIEYFKVWGMPIPSLRAVVVLSFVALVSAITFSRFILFQQESLGQAKASDLIKKIDVSQSGYYRFISFTTTLPVLSRIILRDRGGKTITKMMSEKPSKLHFITISDFPQQAEVYYQIYLIDKDGKWIRTEEKKLEKR